MCSTDDPKFVGYSIYVRNTEYWSFSQNEQLITKEVRIYYDGWFTNNNNKFCIRTYYEFLIIHIESME